VELHAPRADKDNRNSSFPATTSAVPSSANHLLKEFDPGFACQKHIQSCFQRTLPVETRKAAADRRSPLGPEPATARGEKYRGIPPSAINLFKRASKGPAYPIA